MNNGQFVILIFIYLSLFAKDDSAAGDDSSNNEDSAAGEPAGTGIDLVPKVNRAPSLLKKVAMEGAPEVSSSPPGSVGHHFPPDKSDSFEEKQKMGLGLPVVGGVGVGAAAAVAGSAAVPG